MAMKMGEIKNMKEDALNNMITELEMELVGGQNQNKVSSIKLSIARIKTYLSQLKKGVLNQNKAAKAEGKRTIVSNPKVVAGNTGKKEARKEKKQ